MELSKIDYRRRIGRTIALSRCSGQMLKDGEFFDVYEELPGRYTPERATRKLRRELGDETITINHVETETHYYSMPLEDFMIHAEITA